MEIINRLYEQITLLRIENLKKEDENYKAINNLQL